MELDFSTPEKEFCCLKMKEVIQAQIYEEIKDMTDEEVVAYFNTPTDQPLFNRLRNKNKVSKENNSK